MLQTRSLEIFQTPDFVHLYVRSSLCLRCGSTLLSLLNLGVATAEREMLLHRTPFIGNVQAVLRLV